MLTQAVARQAERGLLGLFIAALIWAPLPLASSRPWATALLAGWLALVAAGAALLHALGPQRPGHAPRRHSPAGRRQPQQISEPPHSIPAGAWAVGTLLLGFTLWVSWQASPWGYSAEPYETQVYALRSASYLAAFVAGLLLLSSRRRQTLLLGCFVGAGVLQALLAIALFSGGKSYELMGTDFQFIGRATGSFPNFDHLAQYMALALSAGVGLMLSQMGTPGRPQPPGWQARVQGLIEFMMSSKMLVRLGLVLMVIALVLTRSRAGNGAFFIALLLLGVWVMATSAQLRRPAAVLVASLLVVDIVVVGQWVGLEKVVKRLEATQLVAEQAQAASQPASGSRAVLAVPGPRQEETLEERLRAAEYALQLVQQRPVAGHGAGSFYGIFPAVKGADMPPFRWDHAHNDYVELAAETGLVGLGLLGAVFALSFWRAVRLMNDRAGPQARGLAAGVAMGLLCALLHAVVDFNLQINANALALIVLLVLVWSVQGSGGAHAPQTSR